jgi:integrase
LKVATKRHPEGKQIGGIFNRNGHWYAKVKVRGVQKWRSAATLELAQKALGDLREDAAREHVGIPKVARLTLADFAPVYMKWAKMQKKSWKRDAQSVATLVASLGHYRLPELTKPRVEAFMRARREVESLCSVRAREGFARLQKAGKTPPGAKAPAPRMLAPATVNREVACLRKLLARAVEAGELQKNPIAGIHQFPEAPGRIPTMEATDDAALLAALPEWMRPIARLAILTGCRESEILALRWRHVDFDAGTLAVEDSKSGEARRVPMHPVLIAELRGRRGLPEGWVIEMPCKARKDPTTGKALDPARDPHSVSQAFRRTVRKIGRPDLRFHDLRHVCGSRLLETGASLPEVATMLGHKTLAMAKRYAHTSPKRLANLVAAMPAPAEPAPVPAKAAGAKVAP